MDIEGSLCRYACIASACAACTASAHGAIVHQLVNAAVPADRAGLLVSVRQVQWAFGSGAREHWGLPASGAMGRDLALAGGSAGLAGLMRYSLDAAQSAPGSLPTGLMVGPSSEFGAGAASFGVEVGRWRTGAADYLGSRVVSASGDTHYGWGRIDFDESMSARTLVEIEWQDTPGLGMQVGHAPAAGPMVLLGVAALVGGRRPGRAVRPVVRTAPARSRSMREFPPIANSCQCDVGTSLCAGSEPPAMSLAQSCRSRQDTH